MVAGVDDGDLDVGAVAAQMAGGAVGLPGKGQAKEGDDYEQSGDEDC